MDYLLDLLKEIKRNHMIRSDQKQKECFRDFARKELEASGYRVNEDKGERKGHGLKTFPYCNLETESNEYQYVITAHYDTPNQSNMTSLTNFISQFNIFSKLLKNDSIARQLVNSLILMLAIFFPTLICYAANLHIIGNIFFILSICYIVITIRTTSKKPNINNINDNSSGVISLLSIARRLKDSEHKDKVKFILFDQEEKGLCGSKGRYESNQEDFKDKILINLDCVGIGDILIASYLKEKDLDDQFISVLLSDIEKTFNEDHKVALKKIHESICSDHLSFKNSKAISFSLCEKKGLSYTLLNYHRSSDKYLEIQKIDELVKTISDNIESASVGAI